MQVERRRLCTSKASRRVPRVWCMGCPQSCMRCSTRTGSTLQPSRSASIPSTLMTPPCKHPRRLHAEVEAIEALATWPQCPACDTARTKVRKPLPALAALVDLWCAGVEQDLEHAGLSMCWRAWAKESLFPHVYWAPQVMHIRCTRRKAKLRKALEAQKAWAKQRVRTFQRTSSAVEGRKDDLSQM